MRHCGHCHTCGIKLRQVLDGEEWCDICQAYRRYTSHGFNPGRYSSPDEWMPECPEPERLQARQAHTNRIAAAPISDVLRGFGW